MGHGDWIRDLAKSVGLGLEREWWKDGWAGRGGETDHLFCFGLRCTYPEKVCNGPPTYAGGCVKDKESLPPAVNVCTSPFMSVYVTVGRSLAGSIPSPPLVLPPS